LLLIVWALAAAVLKQPALPGPIDVTGRLWSLATTGSLIGDVAKTLARALAALIIALPLGAVIGILLGRRPVLDHLFGQWLTVALNVPALIVGILVYIWLGLTDWALILAVALSKTPVIATTLRSGAQALDGQYDELARALRLPFPRRLFSIDVPQLLPFAIAAIRNGLALAWKIVLVFEILGSDGGVGFRIGILFQHFDVAGILAYTVAFIACVLLIETVVLNPIERGIVGWKSVPA
jgi:NitT/TauT family transport system permease protein